ncbi:NUDIX hydrolase [Pseudoroseomonas sp. WGS1072]|uniref:NUDIX hydrolase n=1 Tax=Roseomonas sp. WGS1072 TaxID=3366816 RepID=UPI003BF24E72
MDDDAIPDWTVLGSRSVLRDRWIDITADRCRDARGNILEDFYTFAYPDWVNVVAITPRDELVLVRQYRHGWQGRVLELPAGAMDAGEDDPAVAGARELREETGYAAPGCRLVSTLSPNTVTHRNRCHAVLALGAELRHPTAHEAGEDITVELWPLPEVLARLGEGLLPQVMHVSALLLALSAAGRLDLRLRP